MFEEHQCGLCLRIKAIVQAGDNPRVIARAYQLFAEYTSQDCQCLGDISMKKVVDCPRCLSCDIKITGTIRRF